MEGYNPDMSTEDIMKIFAGSEFSEDIGNILEGRNIPFEVIDGFVHIKFDTFEHRITKNILCDLFNENIKLKGMECKAFMGVRTLRGEAYPKDFLIPDIIVLNHSGARCGRNGMYEGIPDLIVEVALEDRRVSYEKRWVYQEMGIPEYWVVDLKPRWIAQFFSENGSYCNNYPVYTGGSIKHHECGVELNVDEVFAAIKQEVEFLTKPVDEKSMEERECFQCDRIAEADDQEQTEEVIRELKDKLHKVQKENEEMRKYIRFLEKEVAKSKGGI